MAAWNKKETKSVPSLIQAVLKITWYFESTHFTIHIHFLLYHVTKHDIDTSHFKDRLV